MRITLVKLKFPNNVSSFSLCIPSYLLEDLKLFIVYDYHIKNATCVYELKKHNYSAMKWHSFIHLWKFKLPVWMDFHLQCDGSDEMKLALYNLRCL